ncbi:MAG: flagellar hook-associated protein FlgK [Acidobacteriota bacterium]
MSIFGTLASAARSLDAQRYGLDVTGQNIANVNTPGYARREALLTTATTADQLSAGGGVDIAGLRSVRDALVERRLFQERPAMQREQVLSETLAVVESALGAPGSGLDASLTKFFDAFSQLAEDPLSAPARQQVVLTGQGVSADFRDLVSRLSLAQKDANNRIRAGVDELNSLATRIASLNVAIGAAGANAGQAASVVDEQLAEVHKLAALIDVEVIARPGGGVDVSFAGGQPLVIGERAYAVTAVPAGPNGFFDIVSSGTTVTGLVTEGRLGGYVHARDTAIPAYLTDLDTLAYTLATQVNALHDAGFDRSGADAPVFFTALGAPAGAASLLSVNPAVVADPNLIAAASVAGAVGNNQQARAIANLRDARVLVGGTATLHDGWGNLLYRVGADSTGAKAELRTRTEIVRQVENLRDSVSGVSLDEEAMRMLKFQRAYEANARFFRAVDEAIDVLFTLKR